MTTTHVFPFATSLQSFTVPSGVTSIQVDMFGGDGAGVGGAGLGGAGAEISGILTVTPGEVLHVNTGGKGLQPTGSGFTVGGAGGYNGGGQGGAGNGGGNTGGAGGGGASDVRQGGTALANRVLVAAGGAGSSGEPTVSVGGCGGAGVFVGAPGSGTGELYGYDGAGPWAGGGANGGVGVIAPGTGGTPGNGTTGGVGGVGGVNAFLSGGGGGGGGLNGGAGGGLMSGTGVDYSGGGGGDSYIKAGTASPSAVAFTTQGNGNGVNGRVQFTYNQPPNPSAFTLPVTGSYVDITNCILKWVFSDPDSGDSQTQADIRFRVGTGTWTTITAAVGFGAFTYTIAAGSLTSGASTEVQVQTYDDSSTPSGWGPSTFFTPAALPAATIISPTSGATITSLTGSPFTIAPVYAQSLYQMRRVGDTGGAPNTTIYESLSSTVGSALTFSNGAHATGAEHWQVRVQTWGWLWSPWVDVAVTMDLNPPSTPVVLCSVDPSQPAVTLLITNPAPTGIYVAAVSNDILRTGPDGTTVRIATGFAPNTTYTDLLPTAGVNIYSVIAYAANGATSPSA